MAIKISGTTVIDDDRNLVSTGIATIGTGSSATTIDGVSGIVNIGTGVTINAVTGDINTIGIVTVGQLNVPVEISSFSPAIGATDASISSNIILTFNQTVGFGTTGFIELRTGSASGTLLETLYPSSSGIALTVGGTQLSIDPTSDFGFVEEIFSVMSSGFVVSNGSDFAGINTVGSATTYSFTTAPLSLGDAYEGGYLICQSGGTRWVVAPSSSQVTRDWYSRANANTTAQSISGCTGWFVPSLTQLQNPGFTCRTYWDSIVLNNKYWSDTQNTYNPSGTTPSAGWASLVCTQVPSAYSPAFRREKTCPYFVRSFRCVSY